MNFLYDLTTYHGGRFVLTVTPDPEGGWNAVVSVDGEEPKAFTRATTKGQAVVMALAAELGRQIEDASPRFCCVCDDGEAIRAKHAAAVASFREHQARATGRDEHSVLICLPCLKRRKP